MLVEPVVFQFRRQSQFIVLWNTMSAPPLSVFNFDALQCVLWLAQITFRKSDFCFHANTSEEERRLKLACALRFHPLSIQESLGGCHSPVLRLYKLQQMVFELMTLFVSPPF